MIAARLQQGYTNAKYYQFYTVATILEHVIDCFHTIVSDESNPYHPPLSWLTRKQLKPPKDELYLDLIEECSTPASSPSSDQEPTKPIDVQLSASVRTRLEKCSHGLRKDIISRTKDGCSPLFMVCKFGHYNIAKYLLEHCAANIEQKGRYEVLEDHHVHSVSPIWVAAISGNINIVKLLIDFGADVNSLSDTGSTPLRSVCFLCKDDDSNNSQQANIQEDNRQVTIDIYLEIVKLLVENGADVSKPNYNGGTCLINSIHNCQLTKYIIDHGGDVDASDHQSKTALHYAIQQGRLEVSKLLLSCGANPMLQANFCDDALQLCCLGGHLDIFNYLIKIVNYPRERLIDAYKLLGSSILELHYDLSKVRQLWLLALKVKEENNSRVNNDNDSCEDRQQHVRICDTRRLLAFGDITEFNNEQELEALSADDFRLQSLLISERVLGLDHRETIQRLLYRGTFYINSLRPDRCINLWIYALKLRLQHESVFHFEPIIASQAIAKLFVDLFSQQQQQVNFLDVYDVLSLIIDQLDECKRHLFCRPVSCLHEDIFDLLLEIIVNLLLVLNSTAIQSHDIQLKRKLVKELIRINPRSSNGSSLLHVCITPGVFYGDTNKIMKPNKNGMSPIVELISILIDNGLEVDAANCEGLSPLQALCLASIGGSDKKVILKRLVDSGAHVDRRPSTPEQGEVIRQTLREAGVNPAQFVTLACLAARKVSESNIKFDEKMLTKSLKESIAIH